MRVWDRRTIGIGLTDEAWAKVDLNDSPDVDPSHGEIFDDLDEAMDFLDGALEAVKVALIQKYPSLVSDLEVR